MAYRPLNLIRVSLTLMLAVTALALSAAISIYPGDYLAASEAMFLAGLGGLLISLRRVFARKRSPDAHGK